MGKSAVASALLGAVVDVIGFVMTLYNNHITIGDYGQVEQYAYENYGLVIAHKKAAC